MSQIELYWVELVEIEWSLSKFKLILKSIERVSSEIEHGRGCPHEPRYSGSGWNTTNKPKNDG